MLNRSCPRAITRRPPERNTVALLSPSLAAYIIVSRSVAATRPSTSAAPLAITKTSTSSSASSSAVYAFLPASSATTRFRTRERSERRLIKIPNQELTDSQRMLWRFASNAQVRGNPKPFRFLR